MIAPSQAPWSISPPNAADEASECRFHVATLAFQRAVQLKNGAPPRVDAAGHGPVRVALLEVMAGLVSWNTEAPPPPTT